MTKRDSYKHNYELKFRVTKEEYDYIRRASAKKSVHAMTRKLWFKKGWEDKHKALITEQRGKGIPDSEFLHPADKKALFEG